MKLPGSQQLPGSFLEIFHFVEPAGNPSRPFANCDCSKPALTLNGRTRSSAMSLNLPNRYMWFLIGVVILVLLQSGCRPIQAPPDAEAAGEDAARPDQSTTEQIDSISPNGEWQASALFQLPRGADESYQRLVVAHQSGSPSYTLVDGTFPMGLGYTTVVPYTWSQDGERFYYTNRPQPDGCGLFANGSDLYQVDLATGETVEVLPPNTTWVLGLSPDETKIAYRTSGEVTLTIRDLAAGEDLVYDLTPLLNQDEGQDQMGAIVWSPDSTRFAFAVAHKPCIEGWAESTSIYTLDPESLTLTPRLEQDDRLLIPVAWPDEDTLLVENQVPFDQLDQKHRFTFDLETSAVEPVAGQ
jgi:hypothetical protein